MDQVVAKRPRKAVTKTGMSGAGPASPPPSEGPAVTDHAELEQRTAAALFTLGKQGALDVFERREIAELLDHYGALVSGWGRQSPNDLVRLRFSEFGMDLFTELVALVRLQDAQIVELQATLSEFI